MSFFMLQIASRFAAAQPLSGKAEQRLDAPLTLRMRQAGADIVLHERRSFAGMPTTAKS
jgi:hypothetical protein